MSCCAVLSNNNCRQVMGGEQGMDVPALIQKLKKSHRWHVETA